MSNIAELDELQASPDTELQCVHDDIKQSAGIAIRIASETEEGTVKRFTYSHGEVPFPALVLAPVVHALVERGIECRMVRWTNLQEGPYEVAITSRAEFDLWLTEELKENP